MSSTNFINLLFSFHAILFFNVLLFFFFVVWTDKKVACLLQIELVFCVDMYKIIQFFHIDQHQLMEYVDNSYVRSVALCQEWIFVLGIRVIFKVIFSQTLFYIFFHLSPIFLLLFIKSNFFDKKQNSTWKFWILLWFTFNVIVLAIIFWLPVSKFALGIQDETPFRTYESAKDNLNWHSIQII